MEGSMATLEWSEAGLEGPANESATEYRAGVPEILEFTVSRLRARRRAADDHPRESGVVIDARARFARG
jgi:hypothetical protein